MEYNQIPRPQNFQYTPVTKQEWLSTSTWALYFAILGFIIAGLYILGLLLILFILIKYSALVTMYLNIMPSNVLFGMTLILLLYVASIFVLYLGSRHHWRFSQSIKQAVQHKNQTVLEEGWNSMRKAWKIYGIYTIIMLSVYFVVLLSIGYMIQNDPLLRGD